jgi:hypothetical protein
MALKIFAGCKKARGVIVLVIAETAKGLHANEAL